ncbi:hypothetical protein LVJ94_29460 [Pendulispora rubella]|uniref:Uncharacterized protein n=1 Tax=Pendulispora rubella TaxID=2741070 RepID=A0ABZ2KVN9_9BACT
MDKGTGPAGIVPLPLLGCHQVANQEQPTDCSVRGLARSVMIVRIRSDDRFDHPSDPSFHR